MIAHLRNIFSLKWGFSKSLDKKEMKESLLLRIFLGILEDILFWKRKWTSITFILILNIIFIFGSYSETKLSVFTIYCVLFVTSSNALEAWLKYKHRTTMLQKLASRKNIHLDSALQKIDAWYKKQWKDYIYLRHSNHTKAFLLINLIFIAIFIIGKYVGGYLLIYLLSMIAVTSYVVTPLFVHTLKKIPYATDSDGELEGLLPEVSEKELCELSIDPEPVDNERQTLDNWKPNDQLIDEDSDSSTNSSSVTNISMEKLTSMDRVVETSDSSDEEYIPKVEPRENLQSTLEVMQTAESWSSSAYSALRNLTGAVTSMVYHTNTDETKKSKPASIESSDGFELIDKSELL